MVYAEISEMYNSLTRTEGVLDTEMLDKMVYYTACVAAILLIVLMVIVFINDYSNDTTKIASLISFSAIIAGITMITNIVLLYTMKPKQKRVLPLMKLAQVNKLKKKIKNGLIAIFTVCAAGALGLGYITAYVHQTNFKQLTQSAYKRLRQGISH